MGMKVAQWLLGLGTAIALTGCAAAQNKPTTAGQSYAGWYTEHQGQGLFQPCGQASRWRVVGATELRSKAKAFGLDQDTPVYVRLFGAQSAINNELTVARVEQFGSPTPIRNCPMNGVVIPDVPPAGN